MEKICQIMKFRALTLFCSRQDRLVLDVAAIQILMIIRESRTAPQENL